MSPSVDVVQTGWSATRELVFLECQYQYVVAERSIEPLRRIFFHGLVESDLLLLLFVLRHRGLDRRNGSRHRWLMCLIGYLVVLLQALFARMCAHRLRGMRLKQASLLWVTERGYSHKVVIFCEGDDITWLTFLGLLVSNCSSLMISG